MNVPELLYHTYIFHLIPLYVAYVTHFHLQYCNGGDLADYLAGKHLCV